MQFGWNQSSGGGSGGGGGSGTVTDVSVVSANGFAGTVATSTTTPAITLSTSVTGLLLGNGTAVSGVTTSAGLAGAISDETGSGALVFATSPTLVTPVLGVAAATTINKVALTAPATGSTITVADGKTLTASNTITLTGTDGVSANVSNLKLGTVGCNTSGSPVVTGKVPGFVVCPYAGTITAWNFVVDAGTATVKVWKIATGTAKPTSANSINTSGVAISSNTAVRSTTTSDFTSTTVTANDIFAFNIEAVSGVAELSFQLEITKT